MTREEAIKWLKAINTKEFGWDEFALQDSQREIRERCEQGVREAVDMAIEALTDRLKGEWIPHATSVGLKHYIEYSRCSECGEMALVRMNFCPNCGARMKGGAE